MDIGKTVSDILPWISAALTGGPIGIAGMAVKTVADYLGVKDTTIQSVTNALNGATPEQLLAMKSLDNDFALKMKAIGYQHETDLANNDLEQMRIINASLQSEISNSQNETWYQKAWRPACGFAVAIGSLFAVVMLCIAFILSIFYGKPELMAAMPAFASALALILAPPGAACGIAAWHKGMQQREAQASQKDS